SASVKKPGAILPFLTMTLKSFPEVVADVIVRLEHEGSGVAVGVLVMVGVLVFVAVLVTVGVPVSVTVGVKVMVVVFVGVGVQVPTKPQSEEGGPPPGLGFAG